MSNFLSTVYKICLTVNGRYGFKQECIQQYGYVDGIQIWKQINDVFEYFPIAASIHNKYFCVHGGLTPNLKDFEQLKNLSFPVEIREGSSTIENRMLWSDPDRTGKMDGFATNPRRGPQFGKQACEAFFKSTGTKKIIRAHQTAQDGYWTACDNKVLTVFSAPCYKGVCNNDAAILLLRPGHPEWIFQTTKKNGELITKQIVELEE